MREALVGSAGRRRGRRSKEVRDAIIESGMEDGLQDALDLLEQEAAGRARSGRR